MWCYVIIFLSISLLASEACGVLWTVQSYMYTQSGQACPSDRSSCHQYLEGCSCIEGFATGTSAADRFVLDKARMQGVSATKEMRLSMIETDQVYQKSRQRTNTGRKPLLNRDCSDTTAFKASMRQFLRVAR